MGTDNYEIKPVALKQGVPKAQHNGLFGMEQELIDSPSRQVTAVVTFEVVKIPAEELAGEKWPVVEIKHIEPMRDAGDVQAAVELMQAAYKDRTGQNQLDFDGVEDVDGGEQE